MDAVLLISEFFKFSEERVNGRKKNLYSLYSKRFDVLFGILILYLKSN